MTETFATLWKGLNTMPVAPTAPLINTPKGASPDLIRQANKKIGKGQNRKAILGQLRTSTRKAPAAVIAPPALPDPSSPTTQSGFGGGGYSGNNAVRLGQSSNTGFSQALPPEPSLGKGLGYIAGRLLGRLGPSVGRAAVRVAPIAGKAARAVGPGLGRTARSGLSAVGRGYSALEAQGERHGAAFASGYKDHPLLGGMKDRKIASAVQEGRHKVLDRLDSKQANSFVTRTGLRPIQHAGQTAPIKAAFSAADKTSTATATAAHNKAVSNFGATAGRARVRTGVAIGGIALGSSLMPSTPEPAAPATPAPTRR